MTRWPTVDTNTRNISVDVRATYLYIQAPALETLFFHSLPAVDRSQNTLHEDPVEVGTNIQLVANSPPRPTRPNNTHTK